MITSDHNNDPRQKNYDSRIVQPPLITLQEIVRKQKKLFKAI